MDALMKINKNVITYFRTLFSILVLSLALIACGGSDSSSETSSDETPPAATTGVDSAGTSSTGSGSAGASSIGGGSATGPATAIGVDPDTTTVSLSTYVFNGGDSTRSAVCSSPSFLIVGPIKNRASGATVGEFRVSRGEARLTIGGSSDSGSYSCVFGASGGDRLSVGGVQLTFQVNDSTLTLTLN